MYPAIERITQLSSKNPMLRFGLLCLVFFGTLGSPYTSRAETLITTVVSVMKPERAGEPWLFFLSAGGRVLRLSDRDPANNTEISILNAAASTQHFLEVDFTEGPVEDELNSVVELSHVQGSASDGSMPIEPESAGDGSVLSRIDFKYEGQDLTPLGLFNYFKSFGLRRGSQCFHRAYYWAHQLNRQTGALTYKVFMFFTGKYIRRFNYNWWFHVAPYVYDENLQETVLDPTFLKRPVSMREWTDNFLRNDPHCPVVTNYLGHHAQERDEWCYLVKVPMHYYHPNTVEQVNRNKKWLSGWEKDWFLNARRSRRASL